MKKILLIIIAVVAICPMVTMAMPAKRVSQTVRLADGTELTVWLRGDETFHFYETADGQIVRQTEDGLWERDTRDVHELWNTRLATRNQRRLAKGEALTKRMKAQRRAPFKAAGATKKGLLILVNFKNKAMVNGEGSKAIYEQILNGLGNPYGQNYGSVREYFRGQSYGQFDIEFDVVGPVTLPKDMSYYGRDVGGNDANAGEMIATACQLVDDEVDFSNYDWDGDGEVENIYVTYAGYGQSAGAATTTIWPHQWWLSEAYGQTITLDGVTIETYACGAELDGVSGKTIDGNGTMCHEYSHCLGLPDFYDTRTNVSSLNFGMGTWSLMDYGCYNDGGFHPCGYTAYERWFCGWLEPVELKSGCKVEGMKCIEENPEAYILYNERNRDEYYILANHQQVGWDEKAYGHGMMVLHVDYNKSVWEANTINNTTSRQRMTIIPADNVLSMSTSYGGINSSALAGDLWPGTSRKTSLTDTSTPAAKLYTSNTDGKMFMHKPITDISEQNGLISFVFMGGEESNPDDPNPDDPDPEEPTPVPVAPATPTELAVAVGDATSFTAQWQTVEEAVSYNVQLRDRNVSTTDPAEVLLLSERFAKLTSPNGIDYGTDVSVKLDELTEQTGWKGEKIYLGAKGCKIGNKAGGYLVSPLLTPEGGSLTVAMTTEAFGSDRNDMTLTLLSATDSELQQVTYTMTGEQQVFSFEVNVPCKVMLKPSLRAYIRAFDAYDGDFSAEDLSESESAQAPHRVRTSTFTTTDTLMTFTDLQANGRYAVRVQAVSAERLVSPWTEWMEVELTGNTPDEPTPEEPGDIEDGVMATSNADRSAVWFDLHGRRVYAPRRGSVYLRRVGEQWQRVVLR